MTRRQIVVVGASLPGLRAAEAVRNAGFDGALTIVGEELEAPYDRPLLSKQILAVLWEPEQCRLDQAPELEATWRLGRKANAWTPTS